MVAQGRVSEDWGAGAPVCVEKASWVTPSALVLALLREAAHRPQAGGVLQPR